MKSGLMLAALIALTTSSRPEPSPYEGLMDEIERKVRLPARAEPLSAYGRYYAFDGKGKVEARYLLPMEPAPDPLPDGWACEEVLPGGNDLASREVTCGPEPDMSDDLKAGQRRWFADPEAFPLIFDGGCMVVNVTFDLTTRTVERVSCNGYA